MNEHLANRDSFNDCLTRVTEHVALNRQLTDRGRRNTLVLSLGTVNECFDRFLHFRSCFPAHWP